MKDSGSKLLATLFAEQRVYTVSECTEQIKETLETEFFALHVRGEISNYKRHQSGHWYFTLKDSESQLRGVFFRQWNRLMRFEPENGLEVKVRGRLSVYEPRGEYQIIVETLEPIGIGALQIAFEQQVRKLAAEGLFNAEHKRPLPVFPKRVGLVTSPVGAVLRDILQILARRNPAISVLIAPVRVQGTSAAREIADAIKLLNKYAKQKKLELDVIIVGRGGGSAEDLWAFNEEIVARAIYDSDIPIVSAVGHETDFTIADFVADYRAPTPSVAAEVVSPEVNALKLKAQRAETDLIRALSFYLLKRRSQLRDLIESRGFAETAKSVTTLLAQYRELETRLDQAIKDRLQSARVQFHDSQQQLAATDFRASLSVQNFKLEALKRRVDTVLQQRLARRGHKLALLASQLNLLSPLSVLGRGYALVKDEQDHLVAHAADTRKDQRLKIRFADGEVACRVE